MNTKLGLLVVAVVLGVAACDKPPAKVAGGNEGDMAAKVNGEVVSNAQVEAMVKGQKFNNEQEAEIAKRRALEQMINQTLLAQQAREAGMDQRDDVKLAMERAKVAVLANAYLSEQLGKVSAPSDSDVSEYYKNHPELFVRRKLFHFNEYMIAASVDENELRGMLQKNRDAKPVVQWLSERKVPTQVKSDIKASELLLPPVVNRLAKLRPGEFDLVKVGNTYSVFSLLGVQDQPPMGQEEAMPLIRSRMTAARRIEASRSEVKHAREKAKVEFAGHFAGGAGGESVEALPAAPEGSSQE